MKAVYGEYSLSRSTVVEWRKRFLEGLELLEDDARPAQANRVITPEMTAEVHDLVLNNRRVTVDEIHRLLGISVGTTHTIMHQHLKFRKICSQWVPHQLTAEQRNIRMALSLSHLQRYHEEEYGFLHILSLVTKHGITTLNRKASVRASSGNMRLHRLQRNQRPCTPVLVRP
ncbi:hypothetical protein AVEN_254010-1 [Araneus ventricosus]|uniref:Mos1 transposase HTH domain-containing protein n=1 Tax=Araneus ventricosus TaxID=182803 RepID=A0A4Y2E5S6_ARAVE|nr:hypothetical protein AVEN_254010-1 [Araneus ventricosus]